MDFSDWVPGGFGTADAIVLNDGLVTVIDLKYGRGVRVDAEDNPQAMLYALGALSEFDFIYECKRFKLAIVQPRLDHISEWEISREDLEAWAEGPLSEAAQATVQDDAPLNPGEKQCKFCKGKASCRALADHCISVATDGFGVVGEPIKTLDIDSLSIPEVAKLLPQLDLIRDWAKSLEMRAFSELEAGRPVTGFKLVEGRSVRAWVDDDKANGALGRAGIAVADRFNKKLISPSQAEKLIGKDHNVFKKHVIKPPGKPTLAPESDKRSALEIDPTDGFKEVA